MAALESDQWLREQLDILQVKSRKTAGELAAIAGISQSSYYARYKSPQDFRVGELRSINRIAIRYGLSVLEEDK